METLDLLYDRVSALGRAALALLPGVAVGLVVFTIFYFAGRAVRTVVRRIAQRRGRGLSVALVIGRLVQSVILVLGGLVAATIIFPSFQFADLTAIVGLSSVALGFAFRDILQNFLAGILILWTRPFRIEDQIVYKAFEGTVVDIQTRATFIETYDGRRVVIPNAELFTNAVTVNTANPFRRMEHDIGIGMTDDVEHARRIALATLREIDGVLAEPAPDVCVVDLGDFAVKLRVRWWISPPRRADVVSARDAVLTQLKARLLEAGIELPFPTTEVLFHDRTDGVDGDGEHRRRESWPRPKQRDGVA